MITLLLFDVIVIAIVDVKSEPVIKVNSHCVILQRWFVFAYNGLHRNWWCCRSHIVWMLPLSPVQPICCDDKRHRSCNPKKTHSVKGPLLSEGFTCCAISCHTHVQFKAAYIHGQTSHIVGRIICVNYQWINGRKAGFIGSDWLVKNWFTCNRWNKVQ